MVRYELKKVFGCVGGKIALVLYIAVLKDGLLRLVNKKEIKPNQSMHIFVLRIKQHKMYVFVLS